MAGDVEFLDLARQARRRPPAPAPARAAAAGAYVRRAEDALILLSGLDELGERAAVCRIAEAWLALAEAELDKPDCR